MMPEEKQSIIEPVVDVAYSDLENSQYAALCEGLLKHSPFTFNSEPDKYGVPDRFDPIYQEFIDANPSCLVINDSPFHRGFTEIMHQGLIDFGYNPSNQNLSNSPLRAAKGYREMLWPKASISAEIKHILSVGFESDIDSGEIDDDGDAESFDINYHGMVVLTGAQIYSMCPHHFMLWNADVSCAYIPGKSGKVVGISKLHRLVTLLSKQLVLQETYTQLVVALLMHVLGAEGAACVVRGTHGCMTCRGTKAIGTNITTAICGGTFFHNASTKEELMFHLQQSHLAR